MPRYRAYFMHDFNGLGRELISILMPRALGSAAMKYPVELRKSLALAVLLLGPACKNSQAATGPVAPTDEVWLTEQQALAEQVQVSAVQERDIEDTLVANARVTFDDRRVGHVFSPVTGRVVRISAQFGQHVTKGTPLAVVESPDIGDALSDVQKA